MEEFPGNSRTRKSEDSVDDNSAKARVPARPNSDRKQPEKKVEVIAKGEVVRRKRPLGKRLRETFVGSDAKSVWGYVVLDVLIPAAKDMVADATSQGIEKMLFGEARSTNRRAAARRGSTGGYVNYSRIAGSSSQPPWQRQESDNRELSRRSRASHDFDEIILESRGEAEEVIDRLFDLVSRYEQATVDDLYQLVGITSRYTDRNWGWTDIRGAGVTRVRSGYLLDLPKPEPLER